MNTSLDILPCGYIAFNDAGSIISCNHTLASWLGYTREELAGESIEKIFTRASRIFYNTHFFPLIKLHAKANEIFLSLKRKDDKDLPVLANAQRSTDTGQAIIHCVFMVVEERKKFEQELLNARREAERALQENKQLAELTKSLQDHAIELDKQYRSQKIATENLLQFSKIISHDLQEPIRRIQVFADMILNDPSAASGKTKNMATRIGLSAEKLRTLIMGLQQYIVVDAETLYKPVDLNQVIQAAALKVSEVRQFTDFDLVVDQLPEMEGYPSQLELLFFHLIDNAIKFRYPEKRLSIKVESLVLDENVFRFIKERYRYMQHVRIRFSDNGPGIPEEYKDYIFHLLKKIDTASSGLGLGLPLVKKIIGNHGGQISVSSEPGSGACFEILLPLTMISTSTDSSQPAG